MFKDRKKASIPRSELRAATERARRAAGRNIPWSAARRRARGQVLVAMVGEVLAQGGEAA